MVCQVKNYVHYILFIENIGPKNLINNKISKKNTLAKKKDKQYEDRSIKYFHKEKAILNYVLY